jgi:hypothetical protein
MTANDETYSSPLMQLVVEQLRKDKKATFADIKAVAAKKGLTLYPITFGRAKALLGLVPSAKRGEGKRARMKGTLGAKRGPGRPPQAGIRRGPGRPRKLESTGFGMRRGPGRPRKQSSASDSLGALVDMMKQTEHSAAAYRDALERALRLIGDALGV